MKYLTLSALVCVVCLGIPTAGLAFDQGVSIGYGLAAYNNEKQPGRIEGGDTMISFSAPTFWKDRSGTTSRSQSSLSPLPPM